MKAGSSVQFVNQVYVFVLCSVFFMKLGYALFTWRYWIIYVVFEFVKLGVSLASLFSFCCVIGTCTTNVETLVVRNSNIVEVVLVSVGIPWLLSSQRLLDQWNEFLYCLISQPCNLFFFYCSLFMKLFNALFPCFAELPGVFESQVGVIASSLLRSYGSTWHWKCGIRGWWETLT